MRRLHLLAFVLFSLSLSAQVKQAGPAQMAGPSKATFGAAANNPSYVNSTTCSTGAAACTTGFSPANGDVLLVWAANDSATTALTCSDGEGTGNTYTRDSDTSQSTTIRGSWFHTGTISGSGTYTVTCTGTGANFFIGIIACNGCTGALASVSAGANPSTASANSGTTIAPASMTTSNANVILVDGFTDLGGGNITITQTDASFTTRGSCGTGGSCFLGAIGTRVVSSTAAYSDGFTLTVGSLSGAVGAHAAYK